MSTPSTGPPKAGKLPFKRTISRQSAGAPSTPNPQNEDGLFLFSHSKKYFDQQKREAEERKRKKADEEAKKKKADEAAKRREADMQAEDRGTDSEVEAQLLAETEATSSPARKKRSESRDAKRPRLSSPGANSDDGLPVPPTPRRKESWTSGNSKPRSSRATSSQANIQTWNAVISLDSDDEDDAAPSGHRGAGAAQVDVPAGMASKGPVLDDEQQQSDSAELEPDQEDEVLARFVREARERYMADQAEKLAREADPEKAPAEAVIKVMLMPQMQDIKPMMIRIKPSQKMQMITKCWINRQIDNEAPYAQSVLESVFLSWKGNKLYDHATLATLGMKPDREGHLYPEWQSSKEGFINSTTLIFELWTPELFDEHLLEMEREQKRALGELDELSEEEEQPESPAPKELKLRLKLTSQNYATQNLTVSPDTSIKILAKAFQRTQEIPQDKIVEVRWDGEVLDPDSTVEDAGMEDLDQVEIYVR